MKKRFVLILIILTIAISCSDDFSNSDCSSNCESSEPTQGQLNISLTINKENTKIPIAIYIGKIENNNLYDTDTAYSSSYSTTVDINYYYSVKATYKSGSKTIIAIDGDDVKSINCDSACWKVEDGSFDVRLKYE